MRAVSHELRATSNLVIPGESSRATPRVTRACSPLGWPLSGETYSAQTGITTWSLAANRNNGLAIEPIPDFVASGVVVTDLASVATTAVNGASGSMTFDANTTPAFLSRLVFFTETLGTFATGYLLPPISTELP